MGCVESRQDRDLHSNTFEVVNVNDRGQKEAKLEVTETDLVLHQRNKAPIRWPLRCLRRYGFDAEQFSFESGRRCRTGPGVYTFRCRRAETLFNMLQMQIQNITDDASSREFWPPISSATGDDHDYLQPMQRGRTPSAFGVHPTSLTVADTNGGVPNMMAFSSHINDLSPISPSILPAPPSGFRGDDIAQRSDDRELHPPSTPGVNLPSNNLEKGGTLNFVDGAVIFTSDRPPSYSSSGSDRPSQAERCIYGDMLYTNIDTSKQDFDINARAKLNELRRCGNHLYVNVDTSANRDDEHVYANLCPDRKTPIIPPKTSLLMSSAGSGSSNSGTTTTTEDFQSRHLTYIHLDLDKGSDSSQNAPLSPLDHIHSGFHENVRDVYKGYAQIDIAKTEALAAMRETRCDGSRRTRHNSALAPFISVGRQTSTLSD